MLGQLGSSLLRSFHQKGSFSPQSLAGMNFEEKAQILGQEKTFL